MPDTHRDNRNDQSTRRRPHPGLHPCPVRPHLHPASRLVRRRRDQGRTAWGRRHHPRPAAGHQGRRQPVFHHAEPQQALDHDRRPRQARQGGARSAGKILRRDGGELRPRRAGSHGLHLGAHPAAQSAHDPGLDQRVSVPARMRTARSTKMSPSAPAARPPPPASTTARRW